MLVVSLIMAICNEGGGVEWRPTSLGPRAAAGKMVPKSLFGKLGSDLKAFFVRRLVILLWRASLAASLLGFTLVLTALPVLAQAGWTKQASMPGGRDLARAATVNGRLYVIGGHNSRGEIGTVEAFDPATNSWMTRASMPTPRHQMAVGVVNGIIYVAGGCCPTSKTLEAYDPKRDSGRPRLRCPSPPNRSVLL